MKIGIQKEIRRNETRVALIPDDAKKLVEKGHEVCVMKNAGKDAGFTADDYRKVGITVCDTVRDCDLVISVKEPDLSKLRSKTTVMAYLHVEKGQNAKLLSKLKKKKVLSYAFEELRNGSSERVVNLGFEAGLVGIVEGLRTYGQILEKNGLDNAFHKLRSAKEYGTKDKIYAEVSKLNYTNNGINVVIMGKGRVSSGVQDILKCVRIKPKVLYRKETANIEKYLPEVDILVNSVDWYPEEPRILNRKSLRLMKKTALILDISCDTNGAVETCIPTSWDDPIYEVDDIYHFCISNLPSAIPQCASAHLSEMILPYIMKVANGEKLKSGMMTRNGHFVYQRVDE
ncbi:hypothetical protein ACFL6D_02345 [Spirochaetota bacterium]